MKIGLVCPYSLSTAGGVQNHVLGLARWLVESGDGAAILAPDDDGAALDAAVPVTSSGRSAAVPYNGSVARITIGPDVDARVRRWLDSGGFDVVHVHEPLTPGASLQTLLRSHVPTVATFHTSTPRSRLMRAAGVALRRPLGRLAGRIAVSAVAAEVVHRHLGFGTVIIPNGLWVADFDNPPRQGGWRGGGTARITFLGRRDEPRKGFGLLCEAMEELARRRVPARLVVAGPGQHRLPPGATDVGILPDAARNRALAEADIVVTPNTGRESFGLVLAEAMASGAAVVASDLPAFVDVLGGTGWTFRTGDVAGLAAALENLVHALGGEADPSVTAVLDAARQRAATFDWGLVGPRIRDVYSAAAAS